MQASFNHRTVRWRSGLTLLCLTFPLWFGTAAPGEPVCLSAPRTVAAVGEPVMLSGYTSGTEPSDAAIRPSDVSGTFYDHGDPSPYEQLMLERINQARANPGAEAARLGIDLNQGLDPGTIADTPKQPLATHPLLTAAARDHARWMLEANVFSHTGRDGSTIQQRIVAAGYTLTGSWSVGENIAWGGTTGTVDPIASTLARHDGLFISPGHRVNLMNNGFDEIGVGIELGVFTQDETDYNALMAAQKFARSAATPSPFLVGVAYYDFNGNGRYDVGEGIGGVTVSIAGQSYYTRTASAGGYALPHPAHGATATVVFEVSGSVFTRDVMLPAGSNVKLDFVPDYAPPTVYGQPFAVVGKEQEYRITPVPGATAYHVTLATRQAASSDSPSDLSRMIDGSSEGYTPLSTTVKNSGTAAYRLTHPEGLSTESLTYTHPFFVDTGATLTFYSRLRTATTDQFATVLVSGDDGTSWQTVYEQSGSGHPGETSFTQRTVALAAFAGATIRLRFAYRFEGGSYFAGTDDVLGWFIDDIGFNGLLAMQTQSTATLAPAADFRFTPDAANTFWMSVSPVHDGASWPSGEATNIQAVAPLVYTNWAADIETAAGLPPGALADTPGADYSADGIPNRVAYALGLDPVSRHSPMLVARLSDEGNEWRYAYGFDYTATDVNVYPEVSTNLLSWQAISDPALAALLDDRHVRYQGRIENRLLAVTNAVTRLFIRLVAKSD